MRPVMFFRCVFIGDRASSGCLSTERGLRGAGGVANLGKSQGSAALARGNELVLSSE